MFVLTCADAFRACACDYPDRCLQSPIPSRSRKSEKRGIYFAPSGECSSAIDTATLPATLLDANSAIGKQVAGLRSATPDLTDPIGNTSVIERLGLGNSSTIEQTGSGGFVRVTQGTR